MIDLKARGRAAYTRKLRHPKRPKGSTLVNAPCGLMKRTLRSNNTTDPIVNRRGRSMKRPGSMKRPICPCCGPYSTTPERILRKQHLRWELVSNSLRCREWYCSPKWGILNTTVSPETRLAVAVSPEGIGTVRMPARWHPQKAACIVCSQQFQVSCGERDFLVSRELKMPKRCATCRRGGSTAAKRLETTIKAAGEAMRVAAKIAAEEPVVAAEAVAIEAAAEAAEAAEAKQAFASDAGALVAATLIMSWATVCQGVASLTAAEEQFLDDHLELVNDDCELNEAEQQFMDAEIDLVEREELLQMELYRQCKQEAECDAERLRAWHGDLAPSTRGCGVIPTSDNINPTD